MNVFLTSLMHPDTAKDYSVVEKNFEITAASICSQTDPNLLLVVVCCRIPKIAFHDERIKYHVVDFPAAMRGDDTLPRRKDKGTKLLSGLLFIKKYSPQYVYVIDADDLVDIRLNSFVNSRPLASVGWFADSGFIVDLYEGKQQLKFGLHRYCGSTFISNYPVLMNELKLPDSLSSDSFQSEVLKLVSPDVILDLFDSHGYMEFFSGEGKYKRLPFPSIAWIRNTGENILSDGNVGQGECVNVDFLNRFGLGSRVGLVRDDCHSSSLGKLTYYRILIASYISSRLSGRRKHLFSN